MSIRMKEELRSAGVGLLLGIIGLLFGVFWAIYITVNHEGIHQRLSQAQGASVEEMFVINSGPGGASHAGHGGHESHPDEPGHSGQAFHSEPAHVDVDPEHAGHVEPAQAQAEDHVELMRKELDEIKLEIAKRAPVNDGHGTAEMAAAHERLSKAHVHAMGLGVLSIVISILLAFLPASARAKTFAAACVGTGGIFYPLAWILMGMRTTSLGIAGAEQSVVPMVGLSVMLVGLGILLVFVYTLKWLLKG